jgi:cobalamin biosynthesis protein CobW
MTARLPATVVTGFLGAGKTTLIRYLLANAGSRRLALIVNEFGEVGVDGELLRSCGAANCSEDDIVELANGCICCTVADDFIPTMKRLLDRPQAPDHIVIETSGLALPQPLVRAFNWPEIRSRVTVDGVVTVVDAKAVAEGRFASDEQALAAQRMADPNLDHENPIEELFEDQLKCADLVVLSKIDLLDDTEQEAVSVRIKSQLRPGARLLRAVHGEVSTPILLGLDAAAEDDLQARPTHHEMEGVEQHDHDDFLSFAVSLGELPSKEALLSRLEAILAAHQILRLKGFANLAGRDGRLVVQAVGPRLNHYFDRPWRSTERRDTSLVVIGPKTIDKEAIIAALRS